MQQRRRIEVGVANLESYALRRLVSFGSNGHRIKNSKLGRHRSLVERVSDVSVAMKSHAHYDLTDKLVLELVGVRSNQDARSF